MSSNQGAFDRPAGSEGLLSAVVAKRKTVRPGLLVPVCHHGEGLSENGAFKEEEEGTRMEGWGHWLCHHG